MITALAVALGLCILFGGGYALRARSAAIGPIVDTVDPNRDVAASLHRLPGIGPSRAQAIIEHRERAVFSGPGDLQQIRGIGPKTVEKISPWLSFDAPPAVTDAANRE